MEIVHWAVQYKAHLFPPDRPLSGGNDMQLPALPNRLASTHDTGARSGIEKQPSFENFKSQLPAVRRFADVSMTFHEW